MEDTFRDFFKEVKPILLKEPLAETLGAFKTGDSVIEYTFIDLVKMAGHACPTMAGAYLCCRKALEKLYPGEVPVRGEISVTLYGEPDEGVYGVMGQAFSFITGACWTTGFRGLGYKFKRKDLLRFDPDKVDPGAMSFEFSRLDTGKSVMVKFYPHEVPFPDEKKRRLGELMEKVLWDASKNDERKEFQTLWMDRVKDMILEEKAIQR